MTTPAENTELHIYYASSSGIGQIVAHKKSSSCPSDNMHLPHFVQKIGPRVQIGAIRVPFLKETGREMKIFAGIGIFFHKVARCVL
ncbi:hypothetical protein [Hoeflea alexandrii]|uniref:hypothetical protein n=1 Tax=Hoeflea alexandrii TaxID=288436 RepID=UPI0022AF4A44|nr:hypothetical protein [Hoeflea alexandrii]MCZ4287319.1 hypothetical protein [Hoeflea alexandrii]